MKKTLKNPAMEQNDSLVLMPGSQRKGTNWRDRLSFDL